MGWIEVPKNEVCSKIENGVNLAVAIFPDNPDYNKTVEMSDTTVAGKIYKLLNNESTVKFFECEEGSL